MLAYILMVIWPVGSLVLFLALTLCARRRLLEGKTDAFVRATSFLHADFKPQYCAPRTRPACRGRLTHSTNNSVSFQARA